MTSSPPSVAVSAAVSATVTTVTTAVAARVSTRVSTGISAVTAIAADRRRGDNLLNGNKLGLGHYFVDVDYLRYADHPGDVHDLVDGNNTSGRRTDDRAAVSAITTAVSAITTAVSAIAAGAATVAAAIFAVAANAATESAEEAALLTYISNVTSRGEGHQGADYNL